MQPTQHSPASLKLITSLKELTNNGNIDAMLTFLEQN